MIVIPLAGLALVLFSGFSRTYTIDSLGSCFFIDIVKMGPFCFATGSPMPEIIVYGANVIGLGLCIYGVWAAREARRARDGKVLG